MHFIDTHCHLYLKEFDADREDVIRRADSAGVRAFYLPNIDSESLPAMLELEAKDPSRFIPMLGLHPCSVNEQVQQELNSMERQLSERSFVAIGEIGLDFYWDQTHAAAQKEAFQLQINWARDLQIPIIIHSRNAMQECIDLVRRNQDGSLKGIFHCFGGSSEEAQQIMDLGFLLGIGGVVTYKKSGLAELLNAIPLQSIVLETDAPYLAPVPYRGKRNEPCYLHTINEAVAQAQNKPPEEVARQTTENALKLFGHSN
jgi:TatD DNase family protein